MADFFSKNIVPQNPVLTVSSLTSKIKDILEGTFRNVTVEGEISNCRPNGSGHLYFTLKDENSQISAVMFRSWASYLTFTPKDGMKIKAEGTVSVYAARGTCQIVIKKMEIAGQGDILQILEERKKRLEKEGLFSPENKKHIPQYPKTLGIVTSPTGAALRDILQITRRRNKSINVIIFPAVVQGDGAAETIVRQIENANDFNLCDVLIVGRGGGSLEDLLPFSEESVVRSVASSRIPVISAVGHEIDWSLSDFAADARAPTPSAAAEIAVPEQKKISETLERYINDYYTVLSAKIERLKLMARSFDIDNMEIRFRAIEQPLLNRLDNAMEALENGIRQKIKDTRQKINNSLTVLEGASPKTILSRGYSMVKTTEGKIVRSKNDVRKGDRIEIYPADGKIEAFVD